jgi:hypothetical protein
MGLPSRRDRSGAGGQSRRPGLRPIRVRVSCSVRPQGPFHTSYLGRARPAQQPDPES